MMKDARRHPAGQVASCAAVAAAACLVGGAVAVACVKANGSYDDDEDRVLLLGAGSAVSLVVWPVAFTIAALARKREPPAFEVVPPQQDGGV